METKHRQSTVDDIHPWMCVLYARRHPAPPESVPILSPRDTNSVVAKPRHRDPRHHNAVSRVDNAMAEKNERDGYRQSKKQKTKQTTERTRITEVTTKNRLAPHQIQTRHLVKDRK